MMLNAYKNYWMGYFNFSGRTSVTEYWQVFFLNSIIATLIPLIDGTLITYIIFVFVNLCPAFAIMTRRLRDGGRSPLYLLFIFLPFFGWIVLLIFLCMPSKISNDKLSSVNIYRPQNLSTVPMSNTQDAGSFMPYQQFMAPTGDPANQYYERDNVGTRQDSMSEAMAYWLVERMDSSKKPPFTLFIMPSYESGEKAMLELPFFHKAIDSGKIICDRLMTFGLYAITSNGRLTGQYEVLICGSDLTLDEFNRAEEILLQYGGQRNNNLAPDPSVQASTSIGNAALVRYSEIVQGNNGSGTYEIYTGPDKASALAFLKTKSVQKGLYYILVYTPEGNFGRDINGIYEQ